MKKLILTLTAIIVAIAGTTTFTYAAAKNNEVTVLTNIGNISKIEVRGNVELYVTNGDKDQVTVSNNYYGENAYVQDQNGVLRISSYKTEKLVVYVTASDLNSIAVYDNSVVRSDKKLSLISLDVTLYNNAYAALKLDNYAANITVNDQAKADLTGNVTEYSSTYSSTSTINRAELVAENASETKIAPKESAKQVSKVEEVVVEEGL
jgi:hypothetical protein